ncbi:MAG: protein kinase [Oscillatoria princeps RMCB-10]|jgi:serine/threonine protein kinase|nr:protein kinase [Oscillatoria princeps RMCB-10]
MPVRFIKDRYALSPNPLSGGMADVYRARDYEQEERLVAVKLFKHEQLEADILAESFRRETQALKELKHPGIVELLDSGVARATGHHFLVLEWMEKDLATLLKEAPPDGWDSFWKAVALPVLEALAFSHSRTIIHRDIKPNNILVGSDGRLKLADFGISKIKSYLQPSITLKDFVSRTFTPPESDDGSYTYTRDVYSFGVLVLKCLTKVELVDCESIPNALKAFDAPPPIVEVIERAVSRDPAERQHNAEVLLAELNAIQGKQAQTQSTKKRPCYLKLTHKALNNLRNELQVSQDEIQKILLEDLNTACAISPLKKSSAANPAPEASEGHYSIFGLSYRYHVAADRDCLTIINAQNFSSAILEHNRERAWVPFYKFKFGKPLVVCEAEEVVSELQLEVEQHEANRRQTRAEEEKQRLFRVWWDILRAKSDWEQNREKPIRYTSATPDGNRAIFQLAELPEDDIAGQPRHVTRTDGFSITNFREKPANSSFNNACEVKVIVQLLKQLNQMAGEANKNYSLAVLTGYSAQLKLLKRSIDPEFNGWKALTIECNTVDAFQGREADIAVYSVTRSNKEGKVGFLRDAARLNVALSRGRVGLVIVGDHYFCRTSSDNPLHQVLDCVERHPENCALTEPRL